MTTTEHYGLERPDPNNDVDEEFFRLQQTLDQLDGIIFALKQLVNQKAAVQHGHTQADIAGLVEALASKMNATTIFSLDDLGDVDGASAAAVNYLLVKGADGQWRPSSAATAIGNHQHSQDDIVGLGTALTALSNAIAQKAAASNVYTKQQVDDAIAAASSLPLGTIIDVYGNGATAAPGYLKVVPGLEITNAYPEFRAWALANGWAVNGSGNPVFPSTDDALFKRQWRSSQTLRDAGRAFGTVQADQMQQVTGSVNAVIPGTGANPAGALTVSAPVEASVFATGGLGTARTITFNTANSPGARTGTQTHPANITVTWFIKAYNAAIDAAQVAAAQVLADLADARARLAAAEAKLTWEKVAVVDFTAQTQLVQTDLGAYRELRIILELEPGASAAANMQVSANNGSSWLAGATDYTTIGVYSQNIDASQASFRVTGNNFAFFAGNQGAAGRPMITSMTFGQFNKAKEMQGTGSASWLSGSQYLTSAVSMNYAPSTALNALKLAFSVASSGRLMIEGIKG